MAANDWESLMNSVFGSGGKLNRSAPDEGEGKKAQTALEGMQQELDALLARQKKEGPAAKGAASSAAKPKPAAGPARPAAGSGKPAPARPGQTGQPGRSAQSAAAAKPTTGAKPATAAKPAAGQAAKPSPAQPAKPRPAPSGTKPASPARPTAGAASAKPAASAASGAKPAARPTLPSAAQLQRNSEQIDQLLARQAAEIAAMSGDLTRELEADGLLSSGAQAAAGQPAAERFAGLAEELAREVLGQEAFLKKLVLAFKRPFVMGAAGEAAANLLLIHGAEGTGRHFALRRIAAKMAERGILPSPEIAWVDLALYPGPAQEKLFLQDLYAALNGPGRIVAFDHYEACHPACLTLLSALAVRGRAELSSRYVVQKGILVEAGTALVPNLVSHLTPKGKYLVFFSEKGQSALADRLGADFVNAVGDVCATGAFTPESLAALAGQQLDALGKRCADRLGLTLAAHDTVQQLAAAQYSREGGVEPILAFCEKLYRALSQYKLEQEPPAGTKAALRAEGGEVLARFGEGEETPLFALLPGGYTGALEEVRAELDSIVGLDAVKEYVLGLADNVQVQKRRRAMGMKAASLSMHMIYTGNPGTGKTTIARIVAKYLKAIGALRGGQLVEVSRADLVGRYVGHTAPQTNQVIASALGGVLFIDEAYSLYRGKEDSFGLEAIDTLVKGMEDHRDDLVVVLAGYSKEMAEFLKANSGLASRFANQIEFPDYTAAELLQITHLQAKGKGYRLAGGCNPLLLRYYGQKQAEDPAKNGNGRMARNLLEAAILNQARRLVNEPDAKLDELLPEDFQPELD